MILLFVTINVDVKTDKKGASKPKKTIDMYEITKKQSQGRALSPGCFGCSTNKAL